MIFQVGSQHENVKLYLIIEEMFDALRKIHSSLKHKVEDRMLYKINKHYKNITRAKIEKYLSFCTSTCQQKK